MKVLVTGGTGGIGTLVVDELVVHGYDVAVVAVDPPVERHEKVEWFSGDAGDPAVVERAATGAEAVVHLAAIPAPVGAPERVFVNNTRATFVTLEVAGRLGMRRAIVTSSISALGLAWANRALSPCYVPIDEAHPFLSEDPYALSKQVDEATAEMMQRRWGLDILVYRLPFTATGDRLAQRLDAVQAEPSSGAKELWAYLDTRDAARAYRLGLEADTHGCHVLYVMAPEIFGLSDTAALLATHHPGSEIRDTICGSDVPYTLERMHRLIGFEPAHHWKGGER
jgi:nucleoside-diphosphate-sugar epimerase